MTNEPARTRSWPYILFGGVALVALIAAVVANGWRDNGPASGAQLQSISNAMADMLEVNPLATLNVKAPAFTLTDQHHRRSTLTAYRGTAVVLTFGDDQCTDLCTLLAQDVLAADKDLGTAARNVQFVSINANTFYPSVSTTTAWTAQHGLSHTTNWHFLTGSPAELSALAKAYGVDVELDHKDKTIVHGTDMFFINPDGNEVQIGQFGVESANTGQFAHAMAQLAVDTLPQSERVHIGGPSPTSSGPSGSSGVGSTPAPIELAPVGGGSAISTATYRGKYVVLNFWATDCPICTSELPAIQKAFASGDQRSVILGVDVSDTQQAAETYIRRAGTRYLMLDDATGLVAGQFEVPGLPYTVILDPRGRVVVRHPGAITTEQLEYLLQTMETENPNG